MLAKRRNTYCPYLTNMKIVLTPLLLCLNLIVYCQPNIPEEEYFDFWIGEWNLTWQDSDSTIGTGKNTISRVMNDKVILESFVGLTGQNEGYVGKSWSVYNRQLKEWKQTWVDSQGAYLDFHAEFSDDNRMFVRKFTGPNGKEVLQRMVFRGIKKNSFTWDWQSSTDGGETWKLQWQIAYRRTEEITQIR